MATVGLPAMFIVAVVPASFHRVIFVLCRFRRRRRRRRCCLCMSAQVVAEQDVLLYYNSRVTHEGLDDSVFWLPSAFAPHAFLRFVRCSFVPVSGLMPNDIIFSSCLSTRDVCHSISRSHQ